MKWDAVQGHLALDRLQASMATLIGRVDGPHANQAIDQVERSAFPES